MNSTLPDEQFRRYCCYIDQDGNECQNQAEYEIWFGYKPRPDDWTDSCSEHLADLFDDNPRFEIMRIEN